METLNKLTKVTTKQRRRVGRGYGSTDGGHTTNRGAKGDNVRGKTKLTFDGTKIKKGWIKRLPFLRGKHRVLSQNVKTVFNLTQIDSWFKADEVVSKETLMAKTGLTYSDLGNHVKILSSGNLTKALTFKGLKLSESTQTKIAASGGKIE